ncbi:MAG TPA: hypothetical protein VJ954_02975 [Ignavibacteriaceae bacterium]|nr:hypothetical protein [Ignavibacteriaceae bacterium]
MNDLLNSHLKKTPPRVPDLFRELGDDAFFVNSDCVITKNQILVKNRVYEILDFLDNYKIRINHIKLLHAYLKGFDAFIVGIDIVSCEVIFRHHRLDTEISVCDWVIIDLDFFEKEVNENTIRFSCKRKQAINDTIHE